MKVGQTKRPELFAKRLINHPGPNSYWVPDDRIAKHPMRWLTLRVDQNQGEDEWEPQLSFAVESLQQ